VELTAVMPAAACCNHRVVCHADEPPTRVCVRAAGPAMPGGCVVAHPGDLPGPAEARL